MSCRVFNRGFEYCIANHVKDLMVKKNFKYLIAEWIPTKKNSLINDFYSSLGFKKFKNKRSKLDFKKISIKNFFIETIEH